MKKIYYLVILLAVVITSCQKQPIVNGGPANTNYVKTNMALTLTAADYALLPSADYPHSTLTIDDTADAHKYIPIILNARDPQLSNGSSANVTYTVSSPYLGKLADSLFADVSYTLTDDDYALLPNNRFKDFSASQILSWLPYKYPTPANNQLELLTFNFFANSTTTTATQSFLYHNGAWMKIYTISPDQYNAIGKGGTFNDFSSSDNANLVGYFNVLLKSDLIVSATAKTGDVQFISFKYFAGSNYQRVIPLTFDGTNWTSKPVSTMTLGFVKAGGTWVPDPTVYYTLTTADTKLIANSTIGTSAQRTNLGQYGDFSGWSAADLNSAIILVLTTDFPTPKVNVNYNVTYLNYTGSDVPTVLKFKYDGSKWSPVTN